MKDPKVTKKILFSLATVRARVSPHDTSIAGPDITIEIQIPTLYCKRDKDNREGEYHKYLIYILGAVPVLKI